MLTRADILGMMAPFLPSQSNEARQTDAVDAQINNLLRYGFLRRMEGSDDRLEVTRLLKYKIDADRIEEIRQKLLAQGPIDEPAAGAGGQ